VERRSRRDGPTGTFNIVTAQHTSKMNDNAIVRRRRRSLLD
jgi:hypothetical protein